MNLKRLYFAFMIVMAAGVAQGREILLLDGPFKADWSSAHTIDPMQMVGVAPGDIIRIYVSDINPNYSEITVSTMSNGWAPISPEYRGLKVTGDIDCLLTEEIIKTIDNETLMIRGAGFTCRKVTLVTDRPEDTRTGYDDLANPDASARTQRIYDLLRDCYGQKSISCSMAEVDWNYKEAEYVKQWTGAYPAMNGFDYIHLTYDWESYRNITPVKNWWDMGGLVTICWHWRAPSTEAEWDAYKANPSKAFEGFYVNGGGSPETKFSPARAVQAGTWENEFVRADLEKVADRIALLQDAGIVVIWRPFHEAAGNSTIYNDGKAWFWWGAVGPEPCVELWKMMFDYFRQRGLNNLIWVWTSQTKDAAWYPGDEYVDIIGRDLYNYKVAEAAYDFKYLSTYYPHKMIALSECGYSGGSNPYISDQWEQGAKWSFAMPWYHYNYSIGKNHQYANDDWWQDWFRKDNVLTMESMRALREEYLAGAGVDNISIDAPAESAAPSMPGCYTIEGIKVERPTHPGLYIIDGRKVLVR